MTIRKLITAIITMACLLSCGGGEGSSNYSMVCFLGGSGSDSVSDIAMDSEGYIYITGKSGSSWGSPITAYTSGDDVFAAKVNPSGKIEWLTFLGGSGNDSAAGICLDSSGNIYIAGTSGASWGTPLRPYTSGSDCFVAKLAGNGTLSWITFLGGSGIDTAGDICVSGTFLYICGSSGSTWGIPVVSHSSGNDIFTARLNLSGNLTWSTFAGCAGDDYGKCIAADNSSVYVAGYSGGAWGTPVRGYTSGNDAVVIKLAQDDGARSMHTFLGGTGSEYGLGLAVSSGGRIYISGYSTAAWGNPVRAYSGGDDGFAACMNSSLALTWNTFLGGTGDDNNCAICLSGEDMYVAGTGDGTWGDPSLTYSGGTDVHVAALSSDGAFNGVDFYGSGGNDVATGITAGGGMIYFTGYSSSAWGNPVLQYSAGGDGFIAEAE